MARKAPAPAKTKTRRAPPPNRRRPLMLTPAAHAEIVAALEAGCTLDMAADMAGIKRTTVRSWRRKGSSDPKAPAAMRRFYVDSTRALAATSAKAAGVMRDMIAGEGEGEAQAQDARLRQDAAKWWLSRGAYRADFGDSVRVDLSDALADMLDRCRPRMSEAAFLELLGAIEAVEAE